MKANLLEVVDQVRRHLAQNGRVSLRMLRLQFDLDQTRDRLREGPTLAESIGDRPAHLELAMIALCEWPAEPAAVLGDEATRAQLLHQAQQGDDEIGALGHAARISSQLSAISAQPREQ